ncbi:restriction endonuclease [Desulfofundulus sp. TPOSR]|uniref:restriction endonuclease n=1 Tax=Desulfofundulus sp. TPOSR TaxID=2714340 RepID=UPI00140A0C71|nr:restriction endonuclease [Desulfofundulus sp. TPOSR]NHM27696.1 restriction endonuclease [Desulfofundulus sp. TPOSR]
MKPLVSFSDAVDIIKWALIFAAVAIFIASIPYVLREVIYHFLRSVRRVITTVFDGKSRNRGKYGVARRNSVAKSSSSGKIGECDFPWHNARACMRLIDQMRGQDFERFLDLMFRRLGYKTILTPELKDHGADVILIDSNGRKIAVQAKKLRYSKNRVGVKALGELYRGMKWYGCDGGIVITNQYFTDQAIEEARKFGIALWDRPQIIKLIKETHSRSGVAGGI